MNGNPLFLFGWVKFMSTLGVGNMSFMILFFNIFMSSMFFTYSFYLFLMSVCSNGFVYKSLFSSFSSVVMLMWGGLICSLSSNFSKSLEYMKQILTL